MVSVRELSAHPEICSVQCVLGLDLLDYFFVKSMPVFSLMPMLEPPFSATRYASYFLFMLVLLLVFVTSFLAAYACFRRLCSSPRFLPLGMPVFLVRFSSIICIFVFLSYFGERTTAAVYYYCKAKMFICLKKNQNAPRPSEHPPVRGEKMSKRLGGIKGCKYKTSSWHLNGFPSIMVVTLGQQYNIGEKPTAILYSYINRHAGTPDKQRRQNSTSSNNKDESNPIIETRTEDHGDENLHNPSTRPRYSPGSRRRAVGDHTRR